MRTKIHSSTQNVTTLYQIHKLLYYPSGSIRLAYTMFDEGSTLNLPGGGSLSITEIVFFQQFHQNKKVSLKHCILVE